MPSKLERGGLQDRVAVVHQLGLVEGGLEPRIGGLADVRAQEPPDALNELQGRLVGPKDHAVPLGAVQVGKAPAILNELEMDRRDVAVIAVLKLKLVVRDAEVVDDLTYWSTTIHGIERFGALNAVRDEGASLVEGGEVDSASPLLAERQARVLDQPGVRGFVVLALGQQGGTGGSNDAPGLSQVVVDQCGRGIGGFGHRRGCVDEQRAGVLGRGGPNTHLRSCRSLEPRSLG